MTAILTDTPLDLWNSDQVRELVAAAVRHDGCSCAPWDAEGCATDAVMDIIRDVLAVTGRAQYLSAARTRQTELRLRAHLDAARALLAAREAAGR